MSSTTLLFVTFAIIAVSYLWPLIVYPFQLRPYTIKNRCNRDCGIIWLTQKELVAIRTDVPLATLQRTPLLPALQEPLKRKPPTSQEKL